MSRESGKRCGRCGRAGREYYSKGYGRSGFDSICKQCKIEQSSGRRAFLREVEGRRQISEYRRIDALCRDRERITGPHMLDLIDRTSQQREFRQLGDAAGIRDLQARCIAVRSIKVLLRGEDIPADMLDAILTI